MMTSIIAMFRLNGYSGRERARQLDSVDIRLRHSVFVLTHVTFQDSATHDQNKFGSGSTP